MESWAQALRKPVIPAEAGIHSIESPWIPATRFRGHKLRGNGGLKETIQLSFVRNQVDSQAGT